LLNYGYRLAEIEASVAVQAVGLDPSFGFSHADRAGRLSFVLDVLEPLRVVVEDVVLNLAEARAFMKRDFSELPTGEVRVLAPFSHEYAELLMPRLATAAAPVVEQVARMLADAAPGAVRSTTPLTRAARRRAGRATWAARSGNRSQQREAREPKIARRCEGCGVPLDHHQRSWCSACWPTRRSQAGRTGSDAARRALNDPLVRQTKGAAISAGKRAARDARIRAAGWEPEDWERRIQPALRAARVTAAQVIDATGLGVSAAYRALQGRQVPDARHWGTLAELAQIRTAR
jgi:hypothetical protein